MSSFRVEAVPLTAMARATADAPAQIVSVDPATETEIARFDAFGPADLDRAAAEADVAFRDWRGRTVAERAVPMGALAAHLRAEADRYARLMTAEMGKPITEARAEVEKCAWACEHYRDNAARLLADEPHASGATKSYVAFEPLGVVLAIMPWNFPFWQLFRFGAAAVMAGNTIVLKHASNVSQCSLAIEGAFEEAGFPAGTLRTVLAPAGAIEPLIADERIRAVTLTGSSDTGARVAELAGRSLKKVVLELGGSDPFIVLPDADLAVTVPAAVRARNQNTGQSCIAAKRFIVVGKIADEFESRFAREVVALRVGDPRDPATQIGPLARADLRDALERQVERSVGAGARVLTGGKRRAGPGFFFEPTVLAGVTDDMPAWREETFGPVGAVRRASSVDEAVALANDSAYGLGASIWTGDAAAGERLARRIEAGQVFVNGIVASDPRLPFGGAKRSGYGRELAAFGIREFTNIKTVWVGPAR
jgi:succinate-semialdehyde dehydrogenase / glutarate-semialdehyde dehydrogenase